MSKPKTPSLAEKRPVQEVRLEIRNYIRNERDTILKKWMALKESIHSEDVRREQFYRKKFVQDTKSLPVNVLKFLGTLKKAVRSTMRHKGGTPYSIVRAMFIYWDADKSGMIDCNELHSCMKSLGVKVTLDECREIIHYYRPQGSTLEEMNYQELLQDIQSGEPSLIAFVTQSEDDERDQNEIRFEEVSDKFVKMPPIVKRFIEAVRNYVLITMRNQGGTPFQHIRFIFNFYDYDYSNGLNYKELMIACHRRMKLAITEDQAREIVDYYDRKGHGDIQYDKFLADVCEDVKPILSFTELSPRQIAEAKRSLNINPFIPKPFTAPPNKILEKFKRDVKAALVNKVNKLGGSVASWIREAFVNWDREYSGKISDWTHLQGAAQRLGVAINEDEAKVLIKCYDRYNTGEMHYDFLAKEIMEEAPHFIMEANIVDPKITPTSRTPHSVTNCLKSLQKAAEKFVKKSKGNLNGKDLLHGTFLRFDGNKTGRIDYESFQKVLDELRASIDDNSVRETCKWFDSNGTQTIDYNELTRQMYGSDITTEKLVLPKIKEASVYSTLASSMASSSTLSRSASDSHYFTQAMASTTIGPSPFGVKASTMERNLENIESQAIKNARMKFKRNKIIAEKVKLERKLADIEDQRKKIIEDYKAKHNKDKPNGQSNASL